MLHCCRMIILALLFPLAPVANLQGIVTEEGSFGGLDLFSSTDEISKLFEKEVDLRKRLGAHLEILRAQVKAMDRCNFCFISFNIHHFESLSPSLPTSLIDKNLRENVTEKEAAEYVAHPVNTYKMIKRAALQWPQVKKKVFDKDAME